MSYAAPGYSSRSLDYPPFATIGDLVVGATRTYPDRLALVDGDLMLTYRDLEDRARRIAGGLRARGVQSGSVIALCMPNSAWFTVSYYAILMAGGTVTPINPSQPTKLVRQQLEEAGAVAVIGNPATMELIRSAAPETVLMHICAPISTAAPVSTAAAGGAEESETVFLLDLLESEPIADFETGPEGVAHLSFTGGTTGVPKAVEVLHRNVIANALQLVCHANAVRPDVSGAGVSVIEVPEALTPHTVRMGTGTDLAIAPLFHALGLVRQNAGVLLGTTVVFTGRFDPAETLYLVEKYGVQMLSGSPALMHALLNVPHIEERDLSSVILVRVGSAPIEGATLQRLGRSFPNALVVEAYGLTEATMMVTCQPVTGPEAIRPNSQGRATFDTELSIRALSDGSEVLTGEVGEIWVRGPQVTRGYRNHDDLTALQYVDGWLRTGDIGRVEADGSLFLAGRSKDLIIYKGYNVYPAAIESVLAEHDAVAQTSVIGRPTDGVGEVPVAFVVVKSGCDAGEELADELMRHVAESVAPYARVRQVVFLDELPVTATGKILKAELRARA